MCQTGERTSENIQNLGVHGNDGTTTAVLFIKIYASKLWSTMGKHRSVGIDNTRSTVSYHDVLSRLYDHPFQ